MRNAFIFILLIFISYSCKSRKSVINTTKTKPTTKTVKNKQTGHKNDKTNTKGEELMATSKVKATNEDIYVYIQEFKSIVQKNMKAYGIPASITMAQGILESGAGFGRLAKEANNHFGIKCHADWQGESITHDDDALQECFRKYKDPKESYKDHSDFLKNRPRYLELFSLEKGDYKAWAIGLKKAGYATDPTYPEKLISLIERYELNRLDNEVLGIENKPIPKEELLPNEYIIQKGDTMYSISKKFNLPIEQLRKINNIEENSISIGQKIKVK